MGRTRTEYDFEDEDGSEALQRAGKALQAPLKGKDAAVRLLKGAGEHLAEAAQDSENVRLASRDLARALVRPELLRHRDQEVRLYVALCLCHILRLNAPNTPYRDDELQSIFELFNAVYAELEDPASPHFQLCLSILETVSQVKCSLLILDLPAWEELAVGMFSTLLDMVNEANAEVLQGTVLELLRVMVEEADELPQAQLDVVLARLLPAHRSESPAGHALAAALLQRTETTVQPYLQKFLTALLVGERTDSDLKSECHALFYAIHETVPQALLPLMPLLREELEAEGDGGRRAAAVDLVARLFTQHPAGAAIINEYEPLLYALLGRGSDAENEVRRKLLAYMPALLEVCEGQEARAAAVVRSLVERLYDPDEGVRKAAVAAAGQLLAARPAMATWQHTQGRGTVLSCLSARGRDKKPGVRREAAGQLAALLRAWVLAAEESPAHAPAPHIIVGVALVLFNLAARDAELGAFVFDTAFRSGVFPPKLPAAQAARWWGALWKQAGDEFRPMLRKILQGKASVQRAVQELLLLRAAAKEQRASSLAGAASSAGAGAASGSLLTGGGADGGQVRNPEARLSTLVHELAGMLKDASKPEEGLQKLLEQKDNHVFRGLAALAAHGCTFKDATTAGKDVMQRVGSKGPVADTVRALVARLMPNLLSPEVLHAAMEAAAQSEEVQYLLVDIAGAVPQLLAQSMDQAVAMFEADDPLLAGCAAKVLARAARPMLAHCRHAKHAVPDSLPGKLTAMAREGSPSNAKAAVKALVAVLGPERAASEAAGLAEQLVEQLMDPATPRSHTRVLSTLKALSMLGRLLPDAFEKVADEVLDWTIGDMMDADLSRGKPLAAAEKGKTGRKWRHPSAVTAVKTAALRTLCQALVPDNPRARPSQAMVERAQLVWGLLEPLLDTDAGTEQFAPFDLVFPSSTEPDQQRAKRQRGAGSGGDEEDEGEELECTDAAWVRYSAVCGLLRLARAYDGVMPASLYANLALTMQEPLLETRRAMTAKLVRAVGWLSARAAAPGGGAYAQRAAKYAAVLALMAVDQEDRNRAAALRALREFVLTRRSVVQRVAAAAAAGGGGGTLLQDMPEFLLPYLLYLLAHHPDYPTPEVLAEFEQADEEEREEVYGPGGTPFTPFVGMLQFALEPLLVPAEQPTSAAEVARGIPATLKLLRSLKFCDDATEEPRSEEVRQLCDLSMVLVRQIADRLTKGKPQQPGSFPGNVMLPRLFRPDAQKAKMLDGSHLPAPAYFTPGLFEDDLFMRRLMNPGLPGPARGGRVARPKQQQQQRGGKRGKQAAAAAVQAEQDEEMAEASDDESVGATPGPAAAAAARQPGSSGQRKRPAGGGKAAKAAAARKAEEPGSGAESTGDAAGAELAPHTKRPAGGAARKAAVPARRQPRRGAAAEAATKLRAESSGEEEDADYEESGPSSGEEEEEAKAVAAARAQLARRGAGAAQPPAAAVRGPGMRADTEDEWDEEEGSDGGPQQHAAPARQQAAAKPAPQQRRQKQQQPQEEQVSPGQENRAAANVAAARRGGGKGKPAAAAAAAGSKPTGKASTKPAAVALKPALKRARA